MKITKEELAARLNGREIGNEVEPEDVRDAKESGLLIVYGASDDLCEFDGVWSDEAGSYNGGDIWINKEGLKTCPEDEQEILEKHGVLNAFMADAKLIETVWDKEDPKGRECSWHYKTDLPHATFDIMENGELYCVGMVIEL